MYFIKRQSDDMWLLGHMRLGCLRPTCVWGENFRDALPIDRLSDAEALARRIGGCTVVFMAIKEGSK